jgi:hypothetical protein
MDGGGESFRRFFVWEARRLVGCHDPSAARLDAPNIGAEEKIGPLRAG